MISIRVANASDVSGAAQIAVSAWEWAFREFANTDELQCYYSTAHWENILDFSSAPDRISWVAVDEDGRVCGFLIGMVGTTVEGFDAEVRSLYVDPHLSRNGIGRKLLENAFRHFHGLGFSNLALCALKENRIACSFYTKMGGQQVKEGDWNGLACIWFGWDVG